MKKFKVTYIEEVAREVTIVAPSDEEVFKRFKEGNFPFTEGKEIGGDISIKFVDEVEKKVYNFSEGDPL